MSEKVPVQSLIDHIKSAVDVDPWAKEMAEELLKERVPVKPGWNRGKPFCGDCGWKIASGDKFCRHCGRPVKWE
jgi:hypothetical protein